MISKAFAKAVREIPGLGIQENYSMANATTFKIGGPADIYAEAESKQALAQLITLCQEEGVPCFIIGAGSNLLVSDNGIDGVVCRLAGEFDNVTVNRTEITAGAAVSLAKLARAAGKAGLSGLEFASGIPGTLGGAVYMNAGAYGGEMKDVVVETEYMDKDGSLHILCGMEHDFSYRHSIFCNARDWTILSVKMRLCPKDPEAIMKTMRDLNARRKEKQPLDKPSAGSTFKRPEGYFAAKLIEDAGLKGYAVGGAAVSQKHAGFVVNEGQASCEDVCRLMQEIQKTVWEKFGVTLEAEVKRIGRK